MVVPVADRLDEGLGGVLGARRGRHSQAHDLAAPEVQDDEGVEDLEPERDDGEPVGGPRLAEMIPDEHGPFLATAAWQARRSVLGDRPRRDMVAELGQLAGNAVLSLRLVSLRHLLDQVDGGSIDPAPRPRFRLVTPEQPIPGKMPPQDRLRSDNGDGFTPRWQQGSRKDQPDTIDKAQPRPTHASPEHVDLMPKGGVLDDQITPPPAADVGDGLQRLDASRMRSTPRPQPPSGCYDLLDDGTDSHTAS
jgi:hypothetical protein